MPIDEERTELPAIVRSLRVVTNTKLVWRADGSLEFEGTIADARAWMANIGPDGARCRLVLEPK